MSLVQLNWNPEDRQLKQFGLLSLVLFPCVTWIWGASWTAIGISAAIGALFATIGTAAPKILKPVFLGLSLILMPIGIVLGEVLLFLAYVMVIVPIGIIFRLKGRDRLQLKFDRECESYWQDKHLPTSPSRYYRQY
ncbi:MAG TPA: hypothetical protein VLA12_16130 [Planctomycetaceae bacterium]|nr:hypothetical protein [Planctomycetaceae bacterium]